MGNELRGSHFPLQPTEPHVPWTHLSYPSPQPLPVVPRPLLLPHEDRQMLRLLNSPSPEGSRACFSTSRPEGGKAALELVTKDTEAPLLRRSSSESPQPPCPTWGCRRSWPELHPSPLPCPLQGPLLSSEGSPEALLPWRSGPGQRE